MVFRTGSVLIVGHCDESILHIIYDFLKEILSKEYYDIRTVSNMPKKKKKKKSKLHKKTIILTV